METTPAHGGPVDPSRPERSDRMALHYQTEYCLGHRGRIRRSYTGFPAFVAIVFDLVFGLLFELVFATLGLAIRIAVLTTHLIVRVLQLYWRLLVGLTTLIVYVATLPFVWIHDAVDRFRPEAVDERASSPPRKPSWAMGREV
jgi:hypothetical protein